MNLCFSEEVEAASRLLAIYSVGGGGWHLDYITNLLPVQKFSLRQSSEVFSPKEIETKWHSRCFIKSKEQFLREGKSHLHSFLF